MVGKGGEMVLSSNLGYPRIGANRELKRVLEGYWRGKNSKDELLETAKELRARHWKLQQDAGIDHIPSNDFSFYDQVLDTVAMVGAVPERYHWDGENVDLDTYFTMARGGRGFNGEVPAMEMTKWFDTNYHYIVPEFEEGQTFRLASTKPIDEFVEARRLGIQTRPVLLGPVSFLLLGKTKSDNLEPLSLLDDLLDVYEQMIRRLDDELQSWLAFARQKLDEIAILSRAVNDGRETVNDTLTENREAIANRRNSDRIHQEHTQNRVNNVTSDMYSRQNDYPVRRQKQRSQFSLPVLPATSIGSLPQTREVRKQRAAHRKGKLSKEKYEDFLREQISDAIRFQEDIGIDVLVHGEFERSDMVEYFGEQMDGIAITRDSWVQSYGSRCVRPPIIYGDVFREDPMTVKWSKYAQSLTEKPVKGMVTGPVTILQWSFVRDDQPRSETCKQVALAIRDEVQDLEEAGIRAIQIDEPALREGLPLHRRNWEEYLEWAVGCFKLASSGVEDSTQIHSHMCYSEFNDIIESIARMDADILSIESSRSQMELLDSPPITVMALTP